MLFFDDIAQDDTAVVGSWRLTADASVRFALADTVTGDAGRIALSQEVALLARRREAS